MDDRIRVSDADREHVTVRLREHFAEGRLSPDELNERISAALSAKTAGELRRIMADLPAPYRGPDSYRGPVVRRGPRIWPLAALALIAVLVLPGAGWLFFAFFQFLLVLWLAACVAGIFAAARLAGR
jgi:hypothetical protein